MTRPEIATVAAMAAIAAGGLLLRLPGLSLRPMHVDEAVHALKFAELWQTGNYVYDPDEFHGPTLYYLTLPIVWLGGWRDFPATTEVTYRIVPLLVGVVTVLLTILVLDGIGRAAAVWTALFCAVSPAMVFYSRYYIQETLFVCFTFLLIAAGWRFVRSRSTAWAIVAGVAAGLVHATKETNLIVFGCIAGAIAGAMFWQRIVPAADRAARAPAAGFLKRNANPIAIGAVVAVIVSVSLYSGFFRHAAGPLDSIRTYATYLDRAGGAGLHDHPWDYYLRTLLYTHYEHCPTWSEAPILALAVVGGAAAFRRSTFGHVRFVRFLVVYAVLMTLSYSAIPYKTPWCALGFLHAWILLAGVGAAELIAAVSGRGMKLLAASVPVAGIAVLVWQSFRGDMLFAPSNGDRYVRSNPYVYAQTSRDVRNLMARVEALAAIHPLRRALSIHVITSDYWPLPWELRRFTNVGYWDDVPPAADAPLIISSPRHTESLDSALHGEYASEFYGLRPNELMLLYVERPLWEAFIASRRAELASQSVTP